MRIIILSIIAVILQSCAMRVLVKDCEPVLCNDCEEFEVKEWVCTARR